MVAVALAARVDPADRVIGAADPPIIIKQDLFCLISLAICGNSLFAPVPAQRLDDHCGFARSRASARMASNGLEK
jgi:hypothetical protein